MDIVNSYLIGSATVAIYMTLLFILAVILKDNSIADIAWGPGFVLTAIIVMSYHGAFSAGNILVTALVAVWGVRLGTRIFRRNAGRGEDWRYRKWRQDWGRLFYLRSFLQVFMLQGVILLLNAAPVIIANSSPAGRPGVLTWTGTAVWLVGFIFESVGDVQLDRFVKNPSNRGKILDTGLWKFTRHPNYFGEVTMWWGIFIISLESPLGYIGIIGPAIITIMILFVSGVPMTERAMADDPLFRDYKKRTSVFIPWFPMKK